MLSRAHSELRVDQDELRTDDLSVARSDEADADCGHQSEIGRQRILLHHRVSGQTSRTCN